MHGKWTNENFIKHHNDNPNIYHMFEEYALEAARYRSRYSAKAIFHVMRWNTMIAEKETEYKIDDGWISHYARLFMERNPNHSKLFETRLRKDTYHNASI